MTTIEANKTSKDVFYTVIDGSKCEDYINRPFDANIVYQRVSNTVKLYAKQRRLMAMVTRV